MPVDLETALRDLRPLLSDPDQLVRAVAAGKRRTDVPAWRRVELRPVDLKAGRRLQVVRHDQTQATTHNHEYGADADAALEALLAEPFGNWHLETVTESVQLRVTKKGLAQVHRAPTSRRQVVPREHDRVPRRLIEADDPLFAVLGAGADKRRQVDAFLRAMAPVVDRALAAAQGRPLHVVDLGCGNAYLTFAAHRYLSTRGAVITVGVDTKQQAADHNTALAARLSSAWEDASGAPRFVVGAIEDCDPFPDQPVDLVLALHACDTATDDSLARAVHWRAPVTVAAPCCHHDLQRQLRAAGVVPPPWGALMRDGILRERFADVLTDALRADLLRLHGHRVDVVEFVPSRHTPRNTMLRVVRTDAPADAPRVVEYAALRDSWGVRPALEHRIGMP